MTYFLTPGQAPVKIETGTADLTAAIDQLNATFLAAREMDNREQTTRIQEQGVRQNIMAMTLGQAHQQSQTAINNMQGALTGLFKDLIGARDFVAEVPDENLLEEFKAREIASTRKIIELLDNISGDGENLFRQLDARINNTYADVSNYNNFNSILNNVLFEPFKLYYYNWNMNALAPWFAPGGKQ